MVDSERYFTTGMRSEAEQGQRWLLIAYLLVIVLQGFAVIDRVRIAHFNTIIYWLPFIAIQIGMMCATWLGHRWARWILFLLILREALLAFQLVLNFSNAGVVIGFSIYLVALYLIRRSDVGEFVRHQHRKHQMSANLEPARLAEKGAAWSFLCPAMAMVILLSGQPVPRGGYDAGPLLVFGGIAALIAGIVMGIVGLVASSQRNLVGPLRAAVAGMVLSGVLAGTWISAAARWPEELERARMLAAQKTKHYLPIQTTVLQIEVSDRIRSELARMLKRDPDDFDTRKPLMAQGANDLQIVELILQVERAFQVKVPDNRIGRKTGEGASALTIEQLADAVAAEMKNKVATAAYTPD